MPRLIDLLKETGWGDDPWFASTIGAESGFNPKARNRKTPCGTRANGAPAYAVGLTQICTIHLDKGGLGEGLTEKDLEDPRVNLKLARKIYESQGRGAWEAETNGSSSAYPQAAALNKDIPVDEGFKWTDAIVGALGPVGLPFQAFDAVGGELPSVGDVADTITDVPSAITSAVKTLSEPGTWFGVSKVVFGGLLVLIGTAGLVFVVAKNVSSATPIGAITKAIK